MAPNPGTGNIFADPAFVSAENLNFSYLPESPCIDAGDPEESDPDGTRTDIGAVYFYHETFEAGDCNYDGNLNVIDIILLINDCILTPGNEEVCLECGDVTGDYNVDVLDVITIMMSIVRR